MATVDAAKGGSDGRLVRKTLLGNRSPERGRVGAIESRKLDRRHP
jgi:hypothetical protein